MSTHPSRKRGRGFVRLLVMLGVLAVIAAGVTAYLLRDRGADPALRPAPSIESANLMSTQGVEKSIRERLTARVGRDVVAECPEKVDQLKGTTFTCEAFVEDDPDVRSIATVTITGGGGQFEWTAENQPTPEPTTPTDGVDVE